MTRLTKYFLFLITLIAFIPLFHGSSERLQFLYNQLTQSDSFKVRIASAIELGKISDGSMAPYLESAFIEEDTQAVRLSILDALAHIPDARALHSLIFLAFDHILTPQEHQYIKTALWNHRKAFDMQEWSVSALSNPYDKQRAIAHWLLSVIGDPHTQIVLIKGLQDPSPLVTKRALQSISLFPNQKSRDACAGFTQSQDPVMQKIARACITTIDRETPAPSHKKPIDHIQHLTQRYIPEEVSNYFQKKESDMILDQHHTTIKPLGTSTKSIQLIHNDTIAATDIQSVLEVDATYSKEDIELIQSFMAFKYPFIQGCYERVLDTKPKLTGAVKVAFSLTHGKATSVSIKQETLKEPQVLTCITSRIQELAFPVSGQTRIDMNYTFTFKPPARRVFIF